MVQKGFVVHFLLFLWYTILMDATHGGDGPTLATGGPTDAVTSEWGQALPPPAQARVLLDAIGEAEDSTVEGLVERILRHVEVRPLLEGPETKTDTDYLSPATGVRAHCPNCGVPYLLSPTVLDSRTWNGGDGLTFTFETLDVDHRCPR